MQTMIDNPLSFYKPISNDTLQKLKNDFFLIQLLTKMAKENIEITNVNESFSQIYLESQKCTGFFKKIYKSKKNDSITKSFTIQTKSKSIFAEHSSLLNVFYSTTQCSFVFYLGTNPKNHKKLQVDNDTLVENNDFFWCINSKEIYTLPILQRPHESLSALSDLITNYINKPQNETEIRINKLNPWGRS